MGRVVKEVEWLGYKLHLLVDVKHGVSLAYQITDTQAGDNEVVAPLVTQAQANLPAGWMKTLAYDKSADEEKVHETLYRAGIKPLIQNRAMGRDERELPLPGGRYPLILIRDKSGQCTAGIR